jgi:hypothetical protein
MPVDSSDASGPLTPTTLRHTFLQRTSATEIQAENAPAVHRCATRRYDLQTTSIAFTMRTVLTVNSDDHPLRMRFHQHGDEKRAGVIIRLAD